MHRVAEAPVPLDSDWLRDHPLPRPDPRADKNERGRVLAIGGSMKVPGGLLLTAEAALRAGAGKVRLATIDSLVLPLGIAMPEAAVLGLGQTDGGELASDAASLREDCHRSDAVIAGPAMTCPEAGRALLEDLLDCDFAAPLVLDAAALAPVQRLRERTGPTLLTPHVGEMALMIGWEAGRIAEHPADAALEAASRFNAVAIIKGATSFIATREGDLFSYAGGGVGLATGGSGDVLAGLAAGLAARGAPVLDAALWAVWLHGEAGRRCGEQVGPIGFLARELLAHVPQMMRAVTT